METKGHEPSYRTACDVELRTHATYGDAQRHARDLLWKRRTRFVSIELNTGTVGWHAFERWSYGEKGFRVEEANGEGEVPPCTT